MRGQGSVYQRGAWKWVCYYHNGVQQREPAKGKDGRNTNDANEVQKFLKTMLDAITTEKGGGPAFLTPSMRRITVHDLLETLKTQFELNGQASQQNLSHLRRADADFGTISPQD